MLILTRKPGESLYIGDHVKVTVLEMKGNQIRLGIDAPRQVPVYREEIYLQILEENKSAAESAMAPDAGLDVLTNLRPSAVAQTAGESGSEREEGQGKKGRQVATLSGSRVGGGKSPEIYFKSKKNKKTDE